MASNSKTLKGVIYGYKNKSGDIIIPSMEKSTVEAEEHIESYMRSLTQMKVYQIEKVLRVVGWKQDKNVFVFNDLDYIFDLEDKGYDVENVVEYEFDISTQN